MRAELARDRRGEAAFTLLEVLVAGIVLTVSTVGLAVVLAQSHELIQSPRQEVAARNWIRSIYAELAAAPFDGVAATYHRRNFDVPPLFAIADDPDGLPGEVVFEYGPNGDTSYYTVTVSVRWRGTKGARQVRSVHYLANVRGDTGNPITLEEIEAAHEAGPLTVPTPYPDPDLDPNPYPDPDPEGDPYPDPAPEPDLVVENLEVE
ncbi:MAG: hypothetical protein V3T86_05010 [Planctomycetota bacterium]